MPPARLFLAVWMAAAAASGQDSRWGDQGDGTYANPVLPGDFSDLDAIRVGRDYYAISSTFQYSPGVVVLHSIGPGELEHRRPRGRRPDADRS